MTLARGPGGGIPWIAALLVVAIAVLAFFGLTVIREWQRSAVALEARRAEQAADSLLATLTRDMRGAQRSVLVPMDFDQYSLRPPDEIVNYVATAFARYPYPESFFGWRELDVPSTPIFFHRRERPPAWAVQSTSRTARYPVTIDERSPATPIVERIRRDAAQGRPFSAFQIALDGVPYQVVARLLYRNPWTRELRGVFGFTVNVDWVRQVYYRQLITEIGRRDEATSGYAFRITDDEGRELAGPGNDVRAEALTSRRFPSLFYDPLTLGAPAADPSTEEWVALVLPVGDAASDAAVQGGNRALLLGGLAIISVFVGLGVALQGARKNAQLVELRSDFVSSVTHELRTPIASIRALADTLRTRRYQRPETVDEYAALIVENTKRLSRHVDNLLTLSRLTDASELYSRTEVSLDEIVGKALDSFRVPLEDASFRIHCDLEPNLPRVLGNPEALLLVCDNLIDNVLRHARSGRELDIRLAQRDGSVVLTVSDRGAGISPDELPHVTQKFFRGRGATASGTGLGLAIVSRTVKEFGGALRIESPSGKGTVVTVRFPAVHPSPRHMPVPEPRREDVSAAG